MSLVTQIYDLCEQTPNTLVPYYFRQDAEREIEAERERERALKNNKNKKRKKDDNGST